MRNPSYEHTEYPSKHMKIIHDYDHPVSNGLYDTNRGSKVTDIKVNATATASLNVTPWFDNWQYNWCEGMPLFVNSRLSRDPKWEGYVNAATPAVLNFQFEHGASLLKQSKFMSGKQKEDVLRRYEMSSHVMSTGRTEDMSEYWRYYGCIRTINDQNTRKTSVSSPSIILCSVLGTTNIKNYWGSVEAGDLLGWRIAVKRNKYSCMFKPNGENAGPKGMAPSEFLQLHPVIKRVNGNKIRHNTNASDPGKPYDEDLDFVYKDIVFDQRNIKIDMFNGDFSPVALDMDTQEIKTDQIITDMYSFGLFIPVGTVCFTFSGNNVPNDDILRLALRCDKTASSLPMITVHLSK